jgi:hypothetical protein
MSSSCHELMHLELEFVRQKGAGSSTCIVFWGGTRIDHPIVPSTAQTKLPTPVAIGGSQWFGRDHLWHLMELGQWPLAAIWAGWPAATLCPLPAV